MIKALRFMVSFDRNHNGLSDAEVTKAGTRYTVRVKMTRCG
jgi:hypothetical protein